MNLLKLFVHLLLRNILGFLVKSTFETGTAGTRTYEPLREY